MRKIPSIKDISVVDGSGKTLLAESSESFSHIFILIREIKLQHYFSDASRFGWLEIFVSKFLEFFSLAKPFSIGLLSILFLHSLQRFAIQTHKSRMS